MPSRRRLLAGVLSAAGLSVCHAAAQARQKVSKATARYQSMPNGIQSCSICSLFVAPDRCKLVIGKVSRDGWCSLFDMVD
jgi:hypothetical protein